MIIDVSNVEVHRCSKPRCHNTDLRRHHRRNEHRWIIHFSGHANASSKRVQRRYAEFRTRYESFDRRDWTRICCDHHEEIHELYERELNRRQALKDYKPLREWTWREALAFMKWCESLCNQWILLETPGTKSRVLTR